MGTMRCFAALPLPEEYQAGLEKLVRALRPGLRSKVSWTRPGNWHLTLKFLGDIGDIEDIGERDLPAVERALAGMRWDPFTLQAGRGGYFPNALKPRVAWVGLAQGAEACRELAGAVDAALTPLGFDPETRPFRAHLTIGRIRKAGRDNFTALLKTMWEREWPEIVVDEFVLFRSTLTPRGPVYDRLASFPARDQ